ncbi:MAG: TGS domain-containing protein, partial [Muribaculaceae bacterium]|nr:TGS domain-containing protein [Muribaculaceae bacterium]
FLDTIKLNLFASEIYVFTPRGDLLTLPADSTVLDMAFSIHSDLGTHCIAGKVNHRLVPLNHKLESGDQVEIITSKSQKPQKEWLGFVNTAKARNRLRRLLGPEAKVETHNLEATIRVVGEDRPGILGEMASTVSLRLGVNITNLHISTGDGNFDCTMQLTASNKCPLRKILYTLTQIKGVTSARTVK